MKICVVGLGKLGAPLAAVLAAKGHDVTGIDANPAMVAAIREGRAPVAEPGLQQMIDAARPRLHATHSWEEAVRGAEASFIIVPTPSEDGDGFTNRYVLDAVTRIGAALRGSGRYHVVNITSTVMPGSTDGPIRAALEAASGLHVPETVGLCYNPEFIALGSVIRDMLHPDLILLGESDRKAGDVIEAVCRSVTENVPPVQRMALVNAETAKIAMNSYVTMKISFANFIAELCEKMPGGNADDVLAALGRDSRVGGKYLKGALGYGGPCFPRDNAALGHLARQLAVQPDLPLGTDAVNRRQAVRLAALVRQQLPPGGAAAILGMAYKPDTPVVDESQGLMIAAELASGGIAVTVHDPLALEDARQVLADRVRYAASLDDAVAGAAVIVIANPDPLFRGLAAIAGDDTVIVDCWRLLSGTPCRARIISLGVH